METRTDDARTDDMSRPDATGRDTEQYTISVPEAAELFTASGLPRTERAIQRFCKKGDLICAFQETAYGSRYLIKQSSIDRLIQQKLQTDAVTPGTDGRDVSRPVASGRDASRQDINSPIEVETQKSELAKETMAQSRDTEARHNATSHDDDEFQKLREENLELKIDKSSRQQVINYLTAELEKSHDEVRELSYNLGVAHTKVAQLEAPRQRPNTDDTPDDLSRQVATDEPESIVTPISAGEGSTSTDAATKVAATSQPDTEPVVDALQKRSWLGRMFGA